MMLSISKETLSTLPAVAYEGRCHIIESASGARDAANYLLKLSKVGFDTETRPSFQKGRLHKVALLQLATPEECFLFRLNVVGITAHIRQLLESSQLLKVGLSTKDDFQALRRLEPELQPEGFFELQSWVKNFGIADQSLSRIHAILFGERISKSQRLTNWEAETLSEAQQHYAAIDAHACLKIYDYLKEGKFHPESSPYKIDVTGETVPNAEEN